MLWFSRSLSSETFFNSAISSRSSLSLGCSLFNSALSVSTFYYIKLVSMPCFPNVYACYDSSVRSCFRFLKSFRIVSISVIRCFLLTWYYYCISASVWIVCMTFSVMSGGKHGICLICVPVTLGPFLILMRLSHLYPYFIARYVREVLAPNLPLICLQ